MSNEAGVMRVSFPPQLSGLDSAGNDFLAVFGQAFTQNDSNQYVSRLVP